MAITVTDRNDPRLGHGVDEESTEQNEAYLVLSKDEMITRGLARPVRQEYIHTECGGKTKMSRVIAETYASNPKFYGSTFCVQCSKHLPVAEFEWLDGSVVGF